MSDLSFSLTETIRTSAGTVAAGRAGAGPALVLAHGWPWSSYSWHRIIPTLAKHYEVFWYDMPGYGQSEMLANQATGLDVQGQVFAQVLEQWALNKPMVLAHDFGGATTLRAHLLHGVQFSRYVLMNVVAMRPWGSAFFEHVGRHVQAFQGLPAHIHEAVVRAYIGGALATDLLPEDVDALAQPWLSAEGKDSFYRQFAQADERFTAEVEPQFGLIRCPVSIVWGALDPWIPLDRGRALAKLVKPVSFLELPDAGHLPQLEQPEQVLAAIDSFLDTGS
ncbi:MAG: alpha/beta fold hydrolase [Burkholderiaceae bacterium]